MKKKILFILLNLFILFVDVSNSLAQVETDTVYIKKDPVVIHKEILFAEEKPKLVMNTSVFVESYFSQNKVTNSYDDDYNKIEIVPNKISSYCTVGVQAHFKSVNISLGIGGQRLKYGVSQESHFISDLDTIVRKEVTILDTIFEIKPNSDTIFHIIQDVTYYKDVVENGENKTTESKLQASYIAIPLKVQKVFRKNKFQFGLATQIISFINVKKQDKLIFTDRGGNQNIIKNKVFNDAYFIVAPEIDLGYFFFSKMLFSVGYRRDFFLKMPSNQYVNSPKSRSSLGIMLHYLF